MALQTFARQGTGVEADRALADVHKAARALGPDGAVLPAISAKKRAAVVANLETFASKTDVIERANSALPRLTERIETAHRHLPLTGLKHRFERTTLLLEDPAGTEQVKRKAAAAMLYLDEATDAIPDELGAIGLMDDDYAFRITLEEVLYPADRPSISHWSEKISALWDDLPFLQGVNLQRGQKPLSISWLDRLNSYVAYNHCLSTSKPALVLLEPSVACSPLHLIVSLLGLLVLEAITSSESRALKLRTGQTYEVDGKHYVRFAGIDDTAWAAGWLRLAVRDGVVVRPPSLADRMIPVGDRRLSLGAEFPAEVRPPERSLIQRFFGWDAAIGPASLPKQIALVTSQQRAQEILKGVVSNGVTLLDHGLVRFVGPEDKEFQTFGTFIFVAPSLMTVRAMLRAGVHLQSVIIDGYDRLRRDRHELPFIAQGLRRVHAVLLDALPVASACIVGGWLDSSFAARLFAHSPQSLSVLGIESDRRRWLKAAEWRFRREGQSLLSAVSETEEPLPADFEPVELNPAEASRPQDSAEEETLREQRVPCVLLWLNGRSEAKALARHARVVFEDGDFIKDKTASLLKPNDRIILGSSVTRWSPEEDFTNAVVEAVRASQPSLVKDGIAWRIALAKARDEARLSIFELRTRLSALGVSREALTLEGWLNLERRSPIAPRSIDRELKAMWPMIGTYTDSKLADVIAACHRLRQLRETSGRALLRLWKGQSVDLGIEQSAADELVSRLRREVQVYEVEAIVFGEVPAPMLGLWLPPWMAAKFEMPHSTARAEETESSPPLTTEDT
jgi:uncharacterized membrane protein YkvA (DUF1232 family)